MIHQHTDCWVPVRDKFGVWMRVGSFIAHFHRIDRSSSHQTQFMRSVKSLSDYVNEFGVCVAAHERTHTGD